MSKKVTFVQPTNILVLPKPEIKDVDPAPLSIEDEKRLVAKAKTKYRYPWWASADPLVMFWGQLNEPVRLVSNEKLLNAAQMAMDSEVLESELSDSTGLVAELKERISPEAIERV